MTPKQGLYKRYNDSVVDPSNTVADRDANVAILILNELPTCTAPRKLVRALQIEHGTDVSYKNMLTSSMLPTLSHTPYHFHGW